MIPARSLVMLAAVPVVLALFALFDETLLWPMLATDVVIIMVALVDGALARKPLVKVTRQARDVFSIGRRNLVTLQLRSLSRRRLEVQVNDDLFAHASAEGLPLQATLPSHGRASVSYHVVPGRRGAYALGDHFVRYASPIGLWTRQLRIEATHPVKVFPDVQAVRQYELLARQNREQSMFRATRRRGGESEFERLREYQREDEYRAIDWKATARRGKLIAREYQLESNQSLLFMLDAGRLMTAEASGMSLLDHALNATLMLSHIASQNGDRVGLLSFADKIKSYAPPASGARATQRIIHAGYRLHPEMVETDYRRAFEQLSARVRKRTLVVLFTQVADDTSARELLRMTRGLLPRHLPLLVMFRDVDVDKMLEPHAGACSDLQLYQDAAAAEVVSWRERLSRDLKRQGALLLDVSPKKLTPQLINRYVDIKARHLL